ncbi:hypothetical protein V3595_20640 [Bacillus sp. CFBP9009]
MVYCFIKPLIGLKKFATLLPKNWLAETPQTLASRRLGRQSAERERISEINWNVIKEEKSCRQTRFLRICLQSRSCLAAFFLMKLKGQVGVTRIVGFNLIEAGLKDKATLIKKWI